MIDRTPFITAALDEVASWRSDPQGADDDAICALLATYPSGSEVAELLWTELPAHVKVEDVADLLSLWCWRTSDNGSQIMRTIERWIDESADTKKVDVAINLEALPFIDNDVRLVRMTLLMDRFPEHRHRCEFILAETRALMGRAR